eukprot:gb/GFBE01077938.1/.p1 GENE.gb/GFBE01077938.1/~~gb/GFBE01077938.1/.p1  ORF type:complete len:667 (+),score=270.51 gb/GFBE01077938.1/:1-2001(+)
MKCHMLGLAALAHGAMASQLAASPVSKVLVLIEELKAEITADMDKESADNAKFEAWCNETQTTATANIAAGEATVEDCNHRIEELSGFEAAGGAEIANAEKNLADNAQRQEEAAKLRETEAKESKAAVEELKASIASMDEALAEFSGGADAKVNTGFLQTTGTGNFKGIRQLLRSTTFKDKVAKSDLKMLSSFVTDRSAGVSALQVDGDDSATDQVVSIIKQTKEDFEKELQESEDDEASKVESHQKLMETLIKEKADLESFLTEQNTSKGNSVKELSDKKVLRDETSIQIKADKKLLTSTQDSCKEKSYQYTERTKLRQQELDGVSTALELLSSDDAAKTFEASAAVAFTQIRKAKTSAAAAAMAVNRQKAYKLLQAAASGTHNFALARLAVEVQGTGAFDKVVAQIDAQVKHLKEEEQEDVDHRDRCLKQMADSDADLATLEDALAKTQTTVERMESQAEEMQVALSALSVDINVTEKDIADRTAARDEERADHLEALKHDEDALELIDGAMEQLKKFFKENVGLVQVDAGYHGAKASTTGVVGTMEMVKEDLVAEIENGKADDNENQQLYEKDFKAMKDLLDAQKAKEMSSNKALAELEEGIQSKKEFQDSKTEEQSAAKTNKANLETDCAWVKTNFQSRRDKRQAEIDSLVEAKGMLAGAEP